MLTGTGVAKFKAYTNSSNTNLARVEFMGANQEVHGTFTADSIIFGGTESKSHGNVIINGPAAIRSGVTVRGNSTTMTFHGTVLNEGTVLTTLNTTTVYLYGSLRNEGEWKPTYTRFMGSASLSGGGSMTTRIYVEAGVVLEGDLNFSGVLDLSGGVLTIGPNMLTLNQPIVGPVTNLIMDSTSSLTVSGTASGISIPGHISALNGLTVSNPNGVTLLGNLQVVGMLTVSSGAVKPGAFTLSFGADAAVRYNGTSAQTTTSVEFPETGGPASIVIQNPAGVTLHDSRTIEGSLTIDSGAFRTAGFTLTLGPNATLTERFGWVVGRVMAARMVAQGTGEAFGGLGLTLQAHGAAPGSTMVVRVTDTTLTGAAGHSIQRYFGVDPEHNGGLDAEVTFAYRDEELGSNNEPDLRLFRSDSLGGPWTVLHPRRNDSLNTLEVAGVDAFSYWTAADRLFGDTLVPPPPANLTAQAGNRSVLLTWDPVDETDLLYYKIYGDTLAEPVTLIDSTSNPADTTVLVTGLRNDVQYSFRVTTVDSSLNESLFSQTATATPYATLTYTLSSHAFAFGKVRMGHVRDTVLTITNTGDDTLHITSITLTDTNFVARPTSLVILPDSSAVDTVSFRPVSGGAKTGHLMLAGNASDDPDSLLLSGFSAVYAVTYEPAALAFGTVPVGSWKDTTILVTNSGNDTLIVQDIQASDTVFAARPVTMVLPPSGSFTDTVRFSPAAAGPVSGYLTFVFSIEDLPDSVAVTGTGETGTGIADALEIPQEYELGQNYPNPFNGMTTIRFGLPEASSVALEVYNVLGQKVANLQKKELPAGFHHHIWHAGVPSGLYFYRIEAVSMENPSRRFEETKRMVLLR